MSISMLLNELTKKPSGSKQGIAYSIQLNIRDPTSQLFWIITNQIRHVSDKYRQGLSQGCPHASNQVISGIARYIERALANEWDVTHFKRDYELPQSVFSRVVFNHILKTDDGGFHTNLSELFSRYDDYAQYQEQLLAKMELDCPF